MYEGLKNVQGDFMPGFPGRFHYMDIDIIMKIALDYEGPLPVTSLVHELFTSMIYQELDYLDLSGIITVIDDLVGVKARKK